MLVSDLNVCYEHYINRLILDTATECMTVGRKCDPVDVIELLDEWSIVFRPLCGDFLNDD